MRPAAALAASGAVALAALGGAAVAPAEHGGGRLAPDLRPADPTPVRIERSASGRLLRFGTSITNFGPGPLEVVPDPRSHCAGAADDHPAVQRVYRDADGDGVYRRRRDRDADSRPAGCIAFHREHGHWHLADFARYRLRRPGGRVVARRGKVSFCLRDSLPDRSRPAGAPRRPRYPIGGDCGPESVEGISVGWADLYPPDLPDQVLELGPLPDGRYCLEVDADPIDRLVEADERNNRASRSLLIAGESVRGGAGGACRRSRR